MLLKVGLTSVIAFILALFFDKLLEEMNVDKNIWLCKVNAAVGITSIMTFIVCIFVTIWTKL